jgi:hypothetical protein
LALLGKVTKDGLVGIGAVLNHIGIGETIKGITISSLDGIQQVCLMGKPRQAW